MGMEILVNITHGETRVALLESGQVIEFYVERRRDASFVGNIYKGKVVKILPGMQSAFVDIGLSRSAFLYVAALNKGGGRSAELISANFRRSYLEPNRNTMQKRRAV